MKIKFHIKKLGTFLLVLSIGLSSFAQNQTINGTVNGEDASALPGVTVVVKGTTHGTVTDASGEYVLSDVPKDAILHFSFVGMQAQDIPVEGQSVINVVLRASDIGLDEVVVVGYGTQRKSDITGAVASVGQDRLEQIPNTNFAQALQGAIPGVTISTNSASAEGGNMSIMVRGRNSIEASNTPLIVLDGIPYSGSISEINPDDIQSIEVLKDASSAAIYGSRGANGVILVTTKRGKTGKPTINYNGYYGIQEIASLPDIMDGEEFWQFKNTRNPEQITDSEREVYESGQWTDWIDVTTRTGKKQQHTLSLSGGTEKMNYFVSGTYLDVEGVAVGDDFQRYSTRFNFEAEVTDWFTLGSNTLLSLADRGGFAPNWSGGTAGAFWMNPLTKAFDENGEPTIYPWPEDVYWGNPLAGTLADSKDKRYKVFTNNYAIVNVPWVPGLQYKLNTGIEYANREQASYYGRNTKDGLENGGESSVTNRVDNDYTVENILSYTNEFGAHKIFATALYSYQRSGYEWHRTDAQGFPNDVLTWHQASTANLVTPSSSFRKETILSQMLRLNYSYDSRYLITVTGRRDGYSGFGTNRKWGTFPSVALGWNIANESFFSDVEFMNQLKLRFSYGENGNQAVGPYETLARLSERSYLDGTSTAPGYRPTKLGNPDLGWEATKSFNFGLDFGFFDGKLSGSLDVYNSDTYDLLLDRSISPVHGITSITENIGKTNNKGIELMLNSYNVQNDNFTWTTSATFSYTKNKIVGLYGYLDEDGNEIDDLGNRWFIGEPIRVNFGRVFDGIWQLDDDIENSAQPDAIPGDAKIVDQITVDTDGDGIPDEADGVINDDDRVIQGQRDPKVMWGLTNTLKYKAFSFTFFLHGMHGHKKSNSLMTDNVWSSRRNTTQKNWWSEDNPSNEWIGNSEDNQTHGATFIESAGFVRVKDVTLSYDLPTSLTSKIGFNKLRVYATGRNLMTFTNYNGLDPELSGDRSVPLQKEYLVGLILGF
ncbi:TonB-dependent receptor [uncultured Draconibacterium sp.]|uniref:SusC/RagA family TonB-linked outer membrane protein n=1 Tax=uncultured Draconibacterium sp. TaxID=1573823 RepID=UPI002AA8DDAE|nr:TonB-dependent receptor [uncultured Draconibacterium sp.]